MRLRGTRPQEWIVAATVFAACVVGAWSVWRDARDLDAISERRRAQLERLAELSPAAAVRPEAAGALEGLFAHHDVVVVRAPWGASLALEASGRAGRR